MRTMPQSYHLTPIRCFVNTLVAGAIRLGIGLPHTYLLTTRGRKTGKAYTTPVALIEQGGERWLVAPYGEVNWVRNARAAGAVTLTRGSHTEILHIEPVAAADSGWILKAYVHQQPITRPYFAAPPDAPPEAFASEAANHPVFHLVPA